MDPDLSLFHLLQRHEVPFVIVGGHAVNYHGYIRATEDSDVVWLRSQESELALVRALAEADARYLGRDIDPTTGIERAHPVSPAYVQSRHLMMLWTANGFLDLFDYVPSFPDVDVAQLYNSSVQSKNGLRFASLMWLRKMKIAAGRAKDLDDLENLPK